MQGGFEKRQGGSRRIARWQTAPRERVYWAVGVLVFQGNGQEQLVGRTLVRLGGLKSALRRNREVILRQIPRFQDIGRATGQGGSNEGDVCRGDCPGDDSGVCEFRSVPGEGRTRRRHPGSLPASRSCGTFRMSRAGTSGTSWTSTCPKRPRAGCRWSSGFTAAAW